MVKVTFYLPVYESEEQVRVTVKQLFNVDADAQIKQRATGTSNINWQDLDSLADLLDAKVTYSPFVTFTIVEPDAGYTEEQQQFLNQPGIEMHRQLEPEELLNDLE